MSARLKPPGTLSFSLVRLCATQGSASAYKDALKEYRPTLKKVVKWTHAPSPALSHFEETCLPPARAQAAGMALRLHTHARPGGWHDSTSRNEPGLEARVHFASFTCFAFAFEGVCVVVFAALCHSPSQPSSRLIQAVLQRSINFP